MCSVCRLAASSSIPGLGHLNCSSREPDAAVLLDREDRVLAHLTRLCRYVVRIRGSAA